MSSSQHSMTLLDACAVVNLYATRHMGGILSAIEGRTAMAEAVAREAQFVFRGGFDNDARDRELIDLQPFLSEGVLAIISSTVEEELLTYIDLSQELDDGEAMTAALAIHRGYSVVTDDRKAVRILTQNAVRVRSTLDIVKTWADQRDLCAQELCIVLTNLRERGNYQPPRSHAHWGWWNTVLGTKESEK